MGYRNHVFTQKIYLNVILVLINQYMKATYTFKYLVRTITLPPMAAFIMTTPKCT